MDSLACSQPSSTTNFQDPVVASDDLLILSQLACAMVIGFTLSHVSRLARWTYSRRKNAMTTVAADIVPTPAVPSSPKIGLPQPRSPSASPVFDEAPYALVDIIMSPGHPRPCPALEMYDKCLQAERGACHYHHGASAAAKVRRYILTAQTSVDIAAQAITSHQIAEVLKKIYRSGVKVRIIRDYDNLCMLKGTSKVSELQTGGIDFKVNGKKHDPRDTEMYVFGIFHHKFVIIDGRVVITGSSNFTRRAATGNFESSVVTDIPVIVEKFAKYFEKAWGEFSSTTEL